MKNKLQKCRFITVMLFLLFIALTIAVSCVDVQPIGPQNAAVGLATLNRLVWERTGVHMQWYHITEWLGLPVLMAPAGFAALGLWQLIRRKILWKVDMPVLLLGALYLLMAALYVLFEIVVVNVRPVMLGEGLEASYPSSHTMLVICVLATAPMALRRMVPLRKPLRATLNAVCTAVILVTVWGRLFSGVHWATDILGGALLSAALVMLYHTALAHMDAK